ncbi:hypothetical protein VPH35_072744 [Triticum aestivum]
MGSHCITIPPSTPPHRLPPSTHTGHFTLSLSLATNPDPDPQRPSPTSRGPPIPPLPSDPEAAGQCLRRQGRRLLRVEPRGAAHARRCLHRMPWQTQLGIALDCARPSPAAQPALSLPLTHLPAPPAWSSASASTSTRTRGPLPPRRRLHALWPCCFPRPAAAADCGLVKGCSYCSRPCL